MSTLDLELVSRPITAGVSRGPAVALHAPTHAAGGADPITISQSQVTGLPAALAALQPLNADLSALAAAGSGADMISYWSGLATAALTALTAHGRALIGGANAAATLATLGLAGLATTGIAGDLTLTKAGSTARTATFPDRNISVAGVTGTLTSGRLSEFDASGNLINSNLQDGVTGGVATLAATLTGNRTHTLPDASIIVAGSSAALTSGRVPFVTTGGLLIDSASITWNGTNFDVAGGGVRGLTVAATGTWSPVSTATSLVISERNSTSLVRTLYITSTAAADEKSWDIRNNNGTWSLRANNDALSTSVAALEITRSGTAALLATFGCPVQGGNGTAAAPGLRLASEASGMYRVSATSLGFSVAGTAAASLTSAGLFSATTLALSGALSAPSAINAANSFTALNGQAYYFAPLLSLSADSANRTRGVRVDVRTASASTFNLTNATLTDNSAFDSTFIHQGTGTITDFTVGAFATFNNSTGTITTLRGIGVALSANLGTINNYVGIEIFGSAHGSSTNYGLRIRDITGGADPRSITTGLGRVLFGDTTDASAIGTAGLVHSGGASIAKNLWVGGTAGNYINIANATGELRVNGTKVVASRRTGWTAATGSATRSTFDTATVTTQQLAERVKALLDDCITHGLIGA